MHTMLIAWNASVIKVSISKHGIPQRLSQDSHIAHEIQENRRPYYVLAFPEYADLVPQCKTVIVLAGNDRYTYSDFRIN